MAQETLRISPLSVGGAEVTEGELDVVRSPWDGRTVGGVPTVGPEEARTAIGAAAEAMRPPIPTFERALVLDRAAADIRERREEFARLLALEAGKPVKQALVEVDRCVQTLTFSAAEARTLAGRGIAMDAHPSGTGHRGFTIRMPVGVVAAITPFNFPLNLAAHKVGPAIAAGCGVVLKPATRAPLTAIELVRTLHRSGLPAALLSVIVGPSNEIADVFVDDPRVGMITFTGSSEVGWSLVARAPRKRVALELGNSTPLIVCADADLEAAATSAATSGYAFAGQSCISVQRVIVDRTVHNRFVEGLVQAAANQRVGDPLAPETDVGPVITGEDRDRISEWIDEAVDAGARRLAGGTIDGGHLRPVVLDLVEPELRIWQREVFGPVIAVRAFDGLDEAIDLANSTDYGLQAGIFTRDLDTAFTAMERLEFGGVTINEAPTFRVDQMPYGGTKGSGNTREGPHFTVREMTEERTVVLRV
ncbi:MAG: aldehyde dehydrogenase family protein [Actinomycetota bacterium]